MIDARAFAATVETWFRANRRDLPWRVEVKGGRSPYYALVSEVMLQQTQASRVADRFARFVERFPSFEALARASEDEVLAEWTGLGYYRRARSLHAAARAIVEHHAGEPPRSAADLRALPGVGRYTAGAIASVCFGERAPIVDANVARVLLRVEGRRLAVADPAAHSFAWDRAARLVEAATSPGAFNEGLMELGGLVCTPRKPACPACPLRDACRARARGEQDEIPLRGAKPEKPIVHHAAAVLRTAEGAFLVERRPAKGLWANLWQAPTLESAEPASAAALRAFVAQRAGLPSRAVRAKDLRPLDPFTRVTSSRVVRFTPFEFAPPVDLQPPDAGGPFPLRAARPEALILGDPPLAAPHRRILLHEG